uniref:Uncharacterized protein n=1 Tax=Solanum tuberosum TaxID=4113 RepID=M1B3D5_SOLTU
MKKEKVRQIWCPSPRCEPAPPFPRILLRVADWSQTVLPQKKFRDQIFKCISASGTCFQTTIS